MQGLFVAKNKEAVRLEQSGLGLELSQPRQPSRGRTISPAKSGTIHGQFTPSPTKTVQVRKSAGQVVDVPLTRKQRRALSRRMAKNGHKAN